MATEVQISVVVSQETKDLLERRTRATGVKMGYLVEQALRHHLLALSELPDDIILRPRIVVSLKSAKAIVQSLSSRPTKALIDLMRSGDSSPSRRRPSSLTRPSRP